MENHIRAKLLEHNDTYNEKTIMLTSFKNKLERNDPFLYKEYKHMPIPEEFKIYISIYRETPDPFFHITTYLNLREQSVSNEIRIKKEKKFICYKLLYREIPIKCEKMIISLIYVFPRNEQYQNNENRYYTVIKTDYESYIEHIDKTNELTLYLLLTDFKTALDQLYK